MVWVLFFLGITNFQEPPVLQPVAIFKSMDDCFKAREILIDKVGRPIISYQAVCVAHDATPEAL